MRGASVHEGVSVHGGGGVSVQRGLCQGVCVHEGGLCPEGSLSGESLSRRGVGPGVSLSRRVSVRGGSLSSIPPRTVTSGQYASYWNAFLLYLNLFTDKGTTVTDLATKSS